jgi:uncharacterized protein (UPF0147 family)
MDIKLIKEIRTQTGASFGDCKKALAQANGDLQKAIEIASNMLEDQMGQEKEEANAQTQEGAINQLKSEFDTLTEIISDKTDPNRLRKVAELISNKYDLGLTEEQKKKYYVTSTLLSPLQTVSEDIKKNFLSAFEDLKREIYLKDSEFQEQLNKLENNINEKFTKFNIPNSNFFCLVYRPMNWSITSGIEAGMEVTIYKCNSLKQLLDGMMNGFIIEEDSILRLTENGTNLDDLYTKSEGALKIENESSNGAPNYYLGSEDLKSEKGDFEEIGVSGKWISVDSKEWDKLIALKSKSNIGSSDNPFLKIIELFIQKIQ